MKRSWIAVSALALLAPFVADARHAAKIWTLTSVWSAQTTPKRGPPAAIGAYAAGCLQGAVPLLAVGPGYEVLHLRRHRFFGHPSLIGFVRRLAEHATSRGQPALLVGDLSQARGGPMPSDHGSHQSGLDVDIAYARPAAYAAQPLPAEQREGLEFPAVADLETRALTDLWSPRVAELLELAASDPSVDRIFVNAVIKRELCERQPQAAWLARLRPWWGHHDHFHVRLRCPPEDRLCRPQPAVPPGNGCDETLAWWLSDEAGVAAERLKHRRRPEGSKLPSQCRSLLR